MSDKIKELAEQAGMTDDKFGMFFAKNKHNEDGVDLEKFAELIVRECAQICKTVGGDQVSNASEDYQEGREMGAEVCHNMIKKYFGVE